MKRVRSGDKTIKLVFFKVVSGRESSVVKIVQDKLGDPQKINYKIFKVFGGFDILLIYETTEKSFLFSGLIEYVLHSEVFDCFTWSTKDKGGSYIESFRFDQLNQPLLGITYLKVNPVFFKNYGAVVDVAMAKALNANNIMALGSFGCVDAILLACDSSIEGLSKKIAENKELGITVEGEIYRLASETVSIFTINFDLCDNMLEHDSNGTNEFMLDNDPMSEVQARLVVSYRPGCTKNINQQLSRIFKAKPVHSLERSEVVLNIRNLKWTDFLQQLLRFRRDNEGEINHTTVNLVSKKSPFSELKDFYCDTGTSSIIQIDDYIGKIEHDDFGRNLLSTFYLINHQSQNPTIRESFDGLKRFIKKILNTYLECLKRDDLVRLTDLVRVAAIQRISGSDIFKKENLVKLFDYKGGIQKVLSAVEVVPATMLGPFGVNWEGFVVIGSAPDYRHDMDVVNIPSKAWLDPSLWWGVFHETGHLYALEREEFKDEVILKYASQCCYLNADPLSLDKNFFSSGTESGTIIRNLIEIIADSFDLHCGFVSDKDLYIKTVWQYLFDDHSSKIYRDINTYAMRTIAALLVDDFAKNVKKEEIDLNDYISKFYSNLSCASNQRVNDTNFNIESLVSTTKSLMPFIEYVSSVFRNDEGIFKKMRAYYKSNKFNQIYNEIDKGLISYDKVDFPHLLILKMLSKKQEACVAPTLPSKIALIKTLWYQSLLAGHLGT